MKAPIFGETERRSSSRAAAKTPGSGQRQRNCRAAPRASLAFRPPASRWAAWASSSAAGSGLLGTLASAGSVIGSTEVYRGEVDVGRRRVDVVMSHERLHHQKVHARFGERGAEGVPQGVGMAGWHAGALAVIAKDAAQPRRGEGLAPMWALRHDEQRLRSRLGALGGEIGLDEAGDLRIEWDGAFLVALADDAHPATPDVHVGHLEAENLGRAQAGEQHEPGDGAVPLAAKAREQRCGLGPVEPAWQPSRLSQRQLRARLRSPKVGEQPTALADGAAASSQIGRATRLNSS